MTFLSAVVVLLMLVTCLGCFWLFQEYSFQEGEREHRRELPGGPEGDPQGAGWTMCSISYGTRRPNRGAGPQRHPVEGIRGHATRPWHLRAVPGKMSDAELQTTVREALRPVRFNEGRGYYFATSMQGVEKLLRRQAPVGGTGPVGAPGYRRQVP